MCTVVILRRPDHDWPLILAANRDEMVDRPWLPPGRHWPDRPEVVAGRDCLADGSWLGLNDDGVVAGVLNRVGTLGPEAGMRSRGELVLEALDHAEASAAAKALSDLEPRSYRTFNLVVADSRDAFWVRGLGPDGPPRVQVEEIEPGTSMITARDKNDASSPRIRAYLPRFRQIPPPDPERDDWDGWEMLLGSRVHDPKDGPTGAMMIDTDTGFGTVSSAIIALPGAGLPGRKPVWRFAAGPPDRTPFRPVEL